MKKVTLSNNETIAFRESGSGDRTIVLIHGNMTSSLHFDVLLERLAEDYHVIAPDMRGFGESSYNSRFDSLFELAEDMLELLQILGQESCTVLGWSTGGGVAMEMAASCPELVEKLILLESVGISGYPMFKKDSNGQPIPDQFLQTKEEIANDPVQVMPVLEAYRTTNNNIMRSIWNALIYTHTQPEPDRYDKYLKDMMTQRNLVDVDYALTRFNISKQHNGLVEGNGRVESIRCPVLVLQGDRDLVVPSYMGQGIKNALGDLCDYRSGDWGHSPMVDDMDGLLAMLRSFI